MQDIVDIACVYSSTNETRQIIILKLIHRRVLYFYDNNYCDRCHIVIGSGSLDEAYCINDF